MVYADTSFLVSLYLPDANSAAAQRRFRLDWQIPLTPFGESEIANAFELACSRRLLPGADVGRAWEEFRGDIQRGVFSLRPLPAATFTRAQALSRQFTRRLGCRTLDVVHVAMALELNANGFCTFDSRQRKLALAAGIPGC
jgi:predicted nucleic acid-binding protein